LVFKYTQQPYLYRNQHTISTPGNYDLTIHTPEPGVETVTVTGPKTIIETIAGAEITYDLGTVTTSVNFNAAIVLVDSEGNEIGNPYIKTDVTDVMVMVPVTMEKTLPLVAHYVANDTDRFVYNVTFSPESVKITGDPRTVAEMAAVEVNVDDITNSPGGSVTTENNLLLPENVKLTVSDCGYSTAVGEFSEKLRAMNLPADLIIKGVNAVNKINLGFDFYKLRPVDSVKNAKIPMLFIHGTGDTFIPHSMCQEVYEACGSEVKEILYIEGADHAQSFPTDTETYSKKLDEMIDKYVLEVTTEA
jgi:hypothetical protein